MVGDCTESPGARILIAAGLCVLALWLSPPATAALAAGQLEDAYHLQVRPVWEGYLRPGANSEVQLRLVADHGGRGSLAVRGSQARVESQIVFDPGVALLRQLPLAHDLIGPAVVEMQTDGGVLLRRELALKLLPAAARVVAVVSGADSAGWRLPLPARETDTVVHVQAQDLPYFASSYSVLGMLVITAADIRVLAPQQALALDVYLGRCGRLHVAGEDAQVAAALRARAGCGGRNIFADSGGVVTARPDDAAFFTPTAATLRQLFSADQTGVLRALLVFLAAYLVVLLLVSRSAQSSLPLLAAPIFAAGLSLLGWTLGAPQSRTASWAEMDSGDTVARYAGLLQLGGSARKEQRLPFDARWGIPRMNALAAQGRLHYAAHEGHLNLRLQTRLLSRHEFFVQGITQAPALTLIDSGLGVEVHNHGQQPSPAGTVAWRGSAYHLPALTAGQTWRAPGEGHAWGDAPQQQLLRQRAVDGSTWMLLPFRVPVFSALATEDAAVGWLLVKGHVDV